MPQTTPARQRRAALTATWRLGDGAPPAGAFVALVPGAEAPLIALNLPATLKGPAREDVARRQALDRLGAGLDVRPARLGNPEGWTRVAVAQRSAVLRWRGALGMAAPRCRGLMPDYLALAIAPGLWRIESDRDGVIARLGPEDGFAAEHALAGRMLGLALSEARATGTLPKAVLLTGETASAFAPLFDGLTVIRAAGDLPEALGAAAMARDDGAVDFARDPRADAQGLETRLRRLALPLALVVLGALGWAGAQALAIRQDRAQAQALEQAVEAAVRRDLIPSGPILDLQTQVTREIARRQAAIAPAAAVQGPLDLLRRAAPVLGAEQVQAVALGATGLSVDLRLEDFQRLDAVTADLADLRLLARVTRSTTDPEGGISASLALEVLP